MIEILLFHHAQGLTPGVRAFADELRAGGHAVHTPDLYDGNTFDDLDAGIGYAKQVGFDTVLERGRHAADGLPNELVYAGFSLADSSLPDYDEAAARTVRQRVLSFLETIG
ncbi:MAG TPA: hypothetical protein VFG75_04675 [Gaiella sp.]|nr:hypothetical protein [Gaiella sp.]